MNRSQRESELYEALLSIALIGHGMNEAVIDWPAIGKAAVLRAQQTIAGKCECCGRAKPFVGRTEPAAKRGKR